MEKIKITIDTTKLTAAAFFTGSKNGKKYLQVDVVPRQGGADQYGKTHSVSVWDNVNKQRIYVGDGRAEEVKQRAPQAPAPSDDDLPYKR